MTKISVSFVRMHCNRCGAEEECSTDDDVNRWAHVACHRENGNGIILGSHAPLNGYPHLCPACVVQFVAWWSRA